MNVFNWVVRTEIPALRSNVVSEFHIAWQNSVRLLDDIAGAGSSGIKNACCGRREPSCRVGRGREDESL
jgi:hypothetical protein